MDSLNGMIPAVAAPFLYLLALLQRPRPLPTVLCAGVSLLISAYFALGYLVLYVMAVGLTGAPLGILVALWPHTLVASGFTLLVVANIRLIRSVIRRSRPSNPPAS